MYDVHLPRMEAMIAPGGETRWMYHRNIARTRCNIGCRCARMGNWHDWVPVFSICLSSCHMSPSCAVVAWSPPTGGAREVSVARQVPTGRALTSTARGPVPIVHHRGLA